MLLEAFLIYNSVISSNQCEINGGIRIAPNVGTILMGQNGVKIDEFWRLGMIQEKAVSVIFMWPITACINGHY